MRDKKLRLRSRSKKTHSGIDALLEVISSASPVALG
jgi:hypothetical protein